MRSLVLLNLIAAVLSAPAHKQSTILIRQPAEGKQVIGQPIVGAAVAPAATVYSASLQPVAGSVGVPLAHGLTQYSAAAVQGAAVVQGAGVVQGAAAVQPISGYSQVHVQPSHIQYASVDLPAKKVQVPVTKTIAEIPIHQKVNYGVQQYVAGHTTTVHKPALAAPAIAPPAVLKQKVSHTAPKVTLKKQEVPVIQRVPEYVEKPYHAGEIVQYTAPQINEVQVATPYKVQVAQPFAVPQPIPVVTKQEVQPVAFAHTFAQPQLAQYTAAVGQPISFAGVNPQVTFAHQQTPVVSYHGVPAVGQQSLVLGQQGLAVSQQGLVLGQQGLVASPQVQTVEKVEQVAA